MMQNIAPHRILAGFIALSALLLTILNVMCQRLVMSGLIQDRLVFDYVNDIMALPLLVGTWVAWRGSVSRWALAGVAIAFSALEVSGWWDPYGRSDPQDILAYWVSGAVLAIIFRPRS